jgi:hypothetical protein
MHCFLKFWQWSWSELANRLNIGDRGDSRHIVLQFLLQLHLSVVNAPELNFRVKIACILLGVRELGKC